MGKKQTLQNFHSWYAILIVLTLVDIDDSSILMILCSANCDKKERRGLIEKWHRSEGGVLLISAHLFRRLTDVSGNPTGPHSPIL